MEDQGRATGGKLTGIRQIVRLKEILQKWQAVTLSPKPDGSCSTPSHIDHNSSTSAPRSLTVPQIINKRLEQVKACCDSDDESIPSPSNAPPDVPKGYLAVYVGEERRRFVIPTDYLKHQLFKVLLEKVEEEFGFDHTGGLTIPCEIETFKYLLKCMETQNRPNHEDAHKGESSADTSEATED